jgi:sugar O-acyltransferase (sialic acid O-acetyltransferase NeuD family)
MEIQNLTIIGVSSATITMILDILESNKNFYNINIYNNLNIDFDKEYLNDNFKINFTNTINDNIILGGANTKVRKKLFEVVPNNKMNSFVNLISKNVDISSTVKLGKGLIINGMVCIAGQTNIDDFVFINRGVSIGHHTFIGKFTTINPGVNIAGNVSIGENCQIGMGTNIIDDIKIGENTIIGAGSLVTKHIPSNVVAYGSPCKIIRLND